MKIRDKVAVASYEGVLVNQHLGMADELLIFRTENKAHLLVDRRPTPEPGNGTERWGKLGELLEDCHTLLVNGIGDTPYEILHESGLTVYEIEGLIDDALDSISSGETLRMPRRIKKYCRRSEENAAGTGCG